VTFAWEFVNRALATLKYWSPDEQLELLNKAKKVIAARSNTSQKIGFLQESSDMHSSTGQFE